MTRLAIDGDVSLRAKVLVLVLRRALDKIKRFNPGEILNDLC